MLCTICKQPRGGDKVNHLRGCFKTDCYIYIIYRQHLKTRRARCVIIAVLHALICRIVKISDGKFGSEDLAEKQISMAPARFRPQRSWVLNSARGTRTGAAGRWRRLESASRKRSSECRVGVFESVCFSFLRLMGFVLEVSWCVVLTLESLMTCRQTFIRCCFQFRLDEERSLMNHCSFCGITARRISLLWRHV